MATYNGERFIEQQLQSISSQTRTPYELVVSDDGSTDKTLDIVRRYANVAPFPVRIHRNDGSSGYASNFLSAARRCSGDLIAFSDQDDIWLATKLERSIAPFVNRSIVLAAHSGAVVDEQLVPAGWRFPDVRADLVAPPLRLDPWFQVSGFAMVFRRQLLDLLPGQALPWEISPDNPTMVHDGWIWFLGTVFGFVAMIRQPLVLYRRHESTATRPASRSAIDLARASLDATHASYSAKARLAGQRAAILESNEPTTHGEAAEHLRKGVAYYRRLERMLEARAEMYQRPISFQTRMSCFVRIASGGGYRGKARGGLGFRSLVKDLTVGLVGLKQ
jgi:glycosyltransferase involved in cell wall biosynthesis